MSDAFQFPKAAFKAYDIRGIVPEELNPDFARLLGRGLAAQARAEGVTAMVVGRVGSSSWTSCDSAFAMAIPSGLLCSRISLPILQRITLG